MKKKPIEKKERENKNPILESLLKEEKKTRPSAALIQRRKANKKSVERSKEKPFHNDLY